MVNNSKDLREKNESEDGGAHKQVACDGGLV